MVNRDGAVRIGGAVSDLAKRRQSLFAEDMEAVVQLSESEKAKNRTKQMAVSDSFIVSTDIDHARHIFAICWCPMLAAFSLILEKSDDMKYVRPALDGVVKSIHLSSQFLLDTERDAFVSCLGKLTGLHATSKDISQKSIQAILAVIDVSKEDGDFLQDSWYEVLRIISKIQKLHVLNSGAQSDADFLDDTISAPAPPTPLMRMLKSISMNECPPFTPPSTFHSHFRFRKLTPQR